jgi:glycosyltransferase involved in cell wall biosynthesis
MRILHTISSPAAGGAEVYVKDLAKYLVKRKSEVHIAFVNKAETVKRSSNYQKEFLQELQKADVSYFFLGEDVRRYPWRGAIRIRNYVRQHKIDIYHAHLTFGVLFGALLRIPRIYTHHSIKMRVNRIAFHCINLLIDELIAICKACAEELEEHSGRAAVTIENAVDDRRIVSLNSIGFRNWDRLNCIAVGRIGEAKNYDLLIEALARLPVRHREKVFVRIVGEGSVDATRRLQSRIFEKGLDETVVLMGNRNDVPSLLAESHLFLMTSRYEGLPIALLEAARTGLPCVVTDVGGCREVIENCRNGVVVPANDAEAIALAIKRFIEEPSVLLAYSENAVRLSSIYSIDRAVSRHLEAYERLANP